MRRLALGFILAAMTLAAPAGAASLSASYLELRRDSDLVIIDAMEAFGDGLAMRQDQLNWRTPSANPLKDLEAVCDDSGRYWPLVQSQVIEDVHRPMRDRREIVEGMRLMLPRQLVVVRDTLPPPGRAAFLKPGETLRAAAKSPQADLRQRAEWYVALDQLVGMIDTKAVRQEDGFGRALTRALWLKLKCNFARNSRPVLSRYLAERGFPDAAVDGSDTQAALVFLIEASGDAHLAALALQGLDSRPPGPYAPVLRAHLARIAGAPMSPSREPR